MKRSYTAFEHIFINYQIPFLDVEKKKKYTISPDGDIGNCGRQNNGCPKDVHVLICKTREYVAFHGTGELRLLIS